MKWVQDHYVEHVLKQAGANFEFRENVAVKSLKREESRQNNARFDTALSPEVCDQYAAKMTAGEPFPAIVVTPSFKILAGNHRVEAAIRASVTSISAYVILNGTKEIYERFTRTDNVRHGLALSEDEKIWQVLELHEKFRDNFTSLNQEFFGGNSRTYKKILAAYNARLASEELIKNGVDASRLDTGVLVELHALMNNKTMPRAAKNAIEYRMNAVEVKEMVKIVKKTKSEQAAAEGIAAYISTIRQSREGKTTQAISSKFIRAMNSLTTILDQGDDGQPISNFKQLELTTSELEKCRLQMDLIAKRFRTLRAGK